MGYALIKTTNHGEMLRLFLTSMTLRIDIENPSKYAPQSPKNIDPLGKFHKKNPNVAHTKVIAVVKVIKSPVT